MFNLIFLYDKGMVNQLLENLGKQSLTDWKAEGIANTRSWGLNMLSVILPQELSKVNYSVDRILSLSYNNDTM